MCICFSHHLHRGASFEWMQLELQVWNAVVGSRRVEISKISRGDDVSMGARREIVSSKVVIVKSGQNKRG